MSHWASDDLHYIYKGIIQLEVLKDATWLETVPGIGPDFAIFLWVIFYSTKFDTRMHLIEFWDTWQYFVKLRMHDTCPLVAAVTLVNFKSKITGTSWTTWNSLFHPVKAFLSAVSIFPCILLSPSEASEIRETVTLRKNSSDRVTMHPHKVLILFLVFMTLTTMVVSAAGLALFGFSALFLIAPRIVGRLVKPYGGLMFKNDKDRDSRYSQCQIFNSQTTKAHLWSNLAQTACCKWFHCCRAGNVNWWSKWSSTKWDTIIWGPKFRPGTCRQKFWQSKSQVLCYTQSTSFLVRDQEKYTRLRIQQIMLVLYLVICQTCHSFQTILWNCSDSLQLTSQARLLCSGGRYVTFCHAVIVASINFYILSTGQIFAGNGPPKASFKLNIPERQASNSTILAYLWASAMTGMVTWR